MGDAAIFILLVLPSCLFSLLAGLLFLCFSFEEQNKHFQKQCCSLAISECIGPVKNFILEVCFSAITPRKETV